MRKPRNTKPGGNGNPGKFIVWKDPFFSSECTTFVLAGVRDPFSQRRARNSDFEFV